MIEIKEPKQCDKGVPCGMCKSEHDVKILTFWTHNSNGGTSIFICAGCRRMLKRKIDRERRAGV